MSIKHLPYAFFTFALMVFVALHQTAEGTAQPMVLFQTSWNQTNSNGQQETYTHYQLAFSNRILNEQTKSVCYVRFKMTIPPPVRKFYIFQNG